jgi:hypothetical protein
MMQGYLQSERPERGFLQPFVEWHTPEGIAFMAGQTLSDERWGEPKGGGMPVSMEAAELLLDNMLPAIVSLPRPVRDWARERSGRAGIAYGVLKHMSEASGSREPGREGAEYVNLRTREIAKLWWRANERAIMEGRWQDVLPGETYDTPKYRALLAKFGGQNGGQNTADGSEPKGTAASATPIVTAGSPAPFSSQGYRWIAVGILAALLATVSGWLLVRSKRKQ